jgi:hypothetical protein
MGLTPKQEKFCQGIVKGLSQSDAYRDAYDCENSSDEVIWKEACNLMKNRNVSVRIQELRAEVTQEIKYTKADCFRQLQEAFAVAAEQNNSQAMRAAADSCAKLLGLNEETDGVNVSVTMMPTVKINGEELELDIGDEPDNRH